jgi:23S rRNA (adenine-N6)-dimethyltransferase
VSEPRARGARRPGRQRSQHFLRSRSLAAELVRDAGAGCDELVLDLGAGTGRLTEALSRVARRVVAVELDRRLASSLRERWENVDVVGADAASVELPREPFRVVANLPFDRTTSILRHLLDDPRVPLVRADVIVEWGVAVKRALPWPSTVNDVLWGAWYATSLARRLPRSAFDPSPSVDAGVLVIERRPCPLVPQAEWNRYRGFVARGFRRPRSVGLRAAPRDLDAHGWAERFSRSRPSSAAASRRSSP